MDPARRPDPGGAGGRLSAGRVLLLALWFGLFAGLLEAAFVWLAAHSGLVVRLSPDFVWMTPVADSAFSCLAGGLLLAGSLVWRPLRSRAVVVGALAALATIMLALVLEKLYWWAVLLLAAGVGVQASRYAVRHAAAAAPEGGAPPGSRTSRRWRRWFVPVSVAMGLGIVAVQAASVFWQKRTLESRWLADLPVAPARAPNVLLLILDTVRARSLELYGYGRTLTPSLDAEARRGVVFDRAIAPAPWTLPSHASFFTGHWPDELSAGWSRPLDATYPTIAEILARHGYATAGFVGNLLFASRETGLARGFIHYDDYPVSVGQVVLSSALGRALASLDVLRNVVGYQELLDRKPASDVTDEFLGWQAQHTRHPFFAFLNYFDAHEPYFPPDSAIRTLKPGEHWDRYRHGVGLLVGASAWRVDKWAMNGDEARVYTAGYEAAIRRIDRQVGRLLRVLQSRGVLRNTLVITAADHGEQLGEHRLWGHHNSVYMASLHVPLVIAYPGVVPADRRVPDVVSLRDLPATILDLTGLGGPAPFPGASLARFWGAADSAASSSTADRDAEIPALSYLQRGYVDEPWYPVGRGPAMYALVDSAYEYIRNGDGSEELYDMRRDPGEATNLAADSAARPVLDAFRTELKAMAVAPGAGPGIAPTSPRQH